MNKKFKIILFTMTLCFSQLLQASTQMILPNYTSQVEAKDQILVDSDTLGMVVIQDSYDSLNVRYFNKLTKVYLFSTQYNYETKENTILIEKNIENTDGLNYIKSYKLNDRPYSWYVDQGSTGSYGDINCVPASVEMAAKWVDESSTLKTQQLRKEYQPYGGGFYESDLYDALSENHFKFSINYKITAESMIEELNEGNLIIAAFDTMKVPQKILTDLFYQGSSDFGHCIVVYGYVELEDGRVFFLTMDPNSLGKTRNSQPKGIKRPFTGTTFIDSVDNFWGVFYGISPEFAAQDAES